jgi:hypothetical protein
MKVQTALSLAVAVKATPYDITLTARKGPYTHWNRDALVQEALESNSSHLMFIDTDVVFPHDGIHKLLGHDKDIVGAMYNVKGSVPPLNTIKFADSKGRYATVPHEAVPKELFKCAAIPTGFMLINMQVFDKLKKPYFPCVPPVGEDVAFCKAAIKADIEIWCDPTIPVGHLGDYLY